MSGRMGGSAQTRSGIVASRQHLRGHDNVHALILSRRSPASRPSEPAIAHPLNLSQNAVDSEVVLELAYTQQLQPSAPQKLRVSEVGSAARATAAWSWPCRPHALLQSHSAA